MSLKKPEFSLHLTSESMSKGTNTVSSSHKSRIGRSTVVLAFLGALAVGHTLLNHPPFSGGLQPNVEQTPVLGQVVWGQCEGYHVPGADCGYITVPTDYHNASVGYTKIALGRYKATASPRRGMVLYNPGKSHHLSSCYSSSNALQVDQEVREGGWSSTGDHSSTASSAIPSILLALTLGVSARPSK